MTNAKPVTWYRCDECGKVYTLEYAANHCCVDRKCEDCGGPVERFYTVCEDCRRKRDEKRERDRWDSAKHVPYSQYDGEMIYCEQLEDFFTDEETLIDRWAEFNWSDIEFTPEPELYVFPTYGVYGTEKVLNALSDLEIIELVESSDLAYEEYEMPEGARAAIKEFCERWDTDWAEYSYFPDYSIGIVSDSGKDE